MTVTELRSVLDGLYTADEIRSRQQLVEPRFLTPEEIAQAAENVPPPQVETLVIPPLEYHAIVLSLVKARAMDRWEGWRLAFNAGFRGPDLLAIAVAAP